MAVYNNGYPVTYQQYYPAQQNMYQTQTPNYGTQNSIIWVQGEAGAKSYLVAPNTTVQLWDSEQQVIYLKSADASGMPSMKVIDYTVRGAELPNTALSEFDNKFISRDEFDVLKDKIEGLQNEINRLKPHKKEGGHNG